MKSAKYLLALILAWIPMACAHAQDQAEVPLAHDLTLEAKEALSRGVPVMIMFERRGCAFCTQLMTEFLLPMRRNAEYDTKVLMRRVDVGSNAPLRIFSGELLTHARFAKQNGIKLTPTIKLFDAQGNELTEPLIGLSTPDYYGVFLDQRIDEALTKVRGK